MFRGSKPTGKSDAPGMFLTAMCWGCVWWFKFALGAVQGATVYRLGLGAPAELAGGEDIRFEEPAYSMGAGAQGDYSSPVLRLRYSSLSTPASTIDYNMQTGRRCLLLPASAAAGLCPSPVSPRVHALMCTSSSITGAMTWLSQTLLSIHERWHQHCLASDAAC